jgi:hypothetical protein
VGHARDSQDADGWLRVRAQDLEVTGSGVGSIRGPVRGGRYNRPFDASPLDLAALGYVEEEYFLSGTVRAYRQSSPAGSEDRWTVVPRDTAAYRTRLLVRRPADPRRFNDTVLVEWLNVSGFMDASVEWTYAHTELIRGGFAWVGVSAQHAGITGSPHAGETGSTGGLKGWDPARYDILDHPGDDYSYDLFSQVGHALRSARSGEPLGELSGARLIATGVSQAAYRLTTYINAIDPIAGVYDGFLLHSRAGGAAPIELPSTQQPLDVTSLEPVLLRLDLRVPVLAMQTETDLVLGYWQARQDDTEHFHLWEVAGAAHADTYIDAGPTDTGCLQPRQLAQTFVPRRTVAGRGFAHLVNAAPQHHYVANAAFARLRDWVHRGTPPATGPRLCLVGHTSPTLQRDEHGNALGGIRSPWMDVPTAVLSGIAEGDEPLGVVFGVTRPFDAATLAQLYTDRTTYLAAFEGALQTVIDAGFLLAADATEIMALASEAYGLGRFFTG